MHLAHLLGDVDVDRAVAGQRRDPAQLVGRRRAQAVRRYAQIGVRQPAQVAPARLDQARKAVRIVQEAALRPVPPEGLSRNRA